MDFKYPNIGLLDLESINFFIDQGMVLLSKKREQVRKAFEQGTDTIFEGHKTRLINTNVNVSETGEYCYKDKGYPIALIWSVREGKVICSLRSNTIDVGDIAIGYGGGGHKFASGFELNFDFLEDLIPEDLEMNK